MVARFLKSASPHSFIVGLPAVYSCYAVINENENKVMK